MANNYIGIFCEDIREETAGSHTIVGVMPDNINFASPAIREPGQSFLFPKMGIYLRINLDTSHKPTGSITARVSFPGLPDMGLGEIAPDAIEKAFAESAANNTPLVGLIFKAVISPLQISQSGLASVFAKVEEKEFLAATLNIQMVT